MSRLRLSTATAPPVSTATDFPTIKYITRNDGPRGSKDAPPS